MKKLLIFLMVAGVMVACDNSEKANEDTANNENVEAPVKEEEHESAEADAQFPENDAIGNFGEAISEEGAIPTTELMSQLEGNDSVFVKVKGNIRACCQAKGCWMRMAVGEEDEMMVKFKDYAFFVPRGASGKDAVVQGWAYVEEVGVDELRHYAEDAGAPKEEIEAITEPEKRLTFMADGVVIAASAEAPATEEGQSPE